MRRGFTLVEMLVVVTVLPFLFLIVDGVFRTLVKDLPLSYGVVQENTILLDMLAQLRRDIDQAKSLPQSHGELAAGGNLLLIELNDGVISYQLTDGRAVRQRLSGPPPAEAEKSRTWTLPHATLAWQVRSKDGRGYAVETKFHVERSIRGQWKKKMANSRLYFLGTL